MSEMDTLGPAEQHLVDSVIKAAADLKNAAHELADAVDKIDAEDFAQSYPQMTPAEKESIIKTLPAVEMLTKRLTESMLIVLVFQLFIEDEDKL